MYRQMLSHSALIPVTGNGNPKQRPFGVCEFDQTAAPSSPSKSYSRLHTSLIVLGFIVALLVSFVLFALIVENANKHIPHDWRIRISITYLLIIIAIVLIPAYRNLNAKHQFSSSALLLWFALTGIAIVCIIRVSRNKISVQLIPTYSIGLIFSVTAFSTIYYPHIKSSWGGGEPVPAVITLSKDSPIMPLQNLRVAIIDESSLGFYVVANGDQKGSFIPRSSVGMIHFSSEPSKQITSTPK